jgi:hypothetical protein
MVAGIFWQAGAACPLRSSEKERLIFSVASPFILAAAHHGSAAHASRMKIPNPRFSVLFLTRERVRVRVFQSFQHDYFSF